MNTKQYNYSYASRIGNALTEPLYKLYKVNTKYLETFDTDIKNVAEKVFYAVNILLLNVVTIPISLSLWFIGKTIAQYTSPKINYSPLSIDTTSTQAFMKVNVLDMMKDYKEAIITEVFSHGAQYYSLYDYRINREFGAIPGLESIRNTDNIAERIHSFLEQQMILTKLRDSNRLIETIQKKLNATASDDMSEFAATDSPKVINPAINNLEKEVSSSRSYIFHIRSLRSHNPDASLEDLMDIMQKTQNREMFGDNIEKPIIKDFPKFVTQETDTSMKHLQNQKSVSNYLVELVSKNHKLSLEESSNFVATHFYSGNNITYRGVHCLLRGIGVLS